MPSFALSALFAGIFLALSQCALASPLNVTSSIEARQNSYVGYLWVHFYDREPSIFFHLSNGNNALSYKTLNQDRAILVPNLGTKGARDPYLVSSADESKHWIIATDLNIDAIGGNWGQAVTKGSRGIFVWESTDLVTWSAARLVQVMDSTAGMVWAPEAIWDSSKNAYLVHWASRLYSSSDPNHTGAATNDQIMYAHTTDFKTFTKAQPYIALSSTPVIDLNILPLGGNAYARFIKDETALRIWEERSDNGLFGTWRKVGSWLVDKVSEGPLSFVDNVNKGLYHVFVDQYGGDSNSHGYVPLQTTDINSGKFTAASTSGFPALIKHGVVKPLTQAQYNKINTKWG